jgi:hypothetical protein
LFYNPKRDNSAGRLNRNEVVVVSIGELMRHFPTPDQKTIKRWRKIPDVDMLSEFESWTKDNIHRAGGLHHVHWYRVSPLPLHPKILFTDVLSRLLLMNALSTPFPLQQLGIDEISISSRTLSAKQAELSMLYGANIHGY